MDAHAGRVYGRLETYVARALKRGNTMKRVLILPVALSMLILLGAAPAQAGSVTEVSILACHNDGGELTVQRGSELWLEMYWGSKTRRQANVFVNRVKSIVQSD